MAAIRNLHLEQGCDYPNSPTTPLSRVLKGVARQGHPVRTRLPITAPLLRSLCARLMNRQDYHHGDHLMLKAAFSTAFHGFFRCGELVNGLRKKDVDISPNKKAMVIFLRRSKTDPNGTGTRIMIGSSPDMDICPVSAMETYLTAPASPHAPLFTYASAQPLDRPSLTEEVRTLLAMCNVPNWRDYASHSFRIGAATTAAVAGVPEYLIRRMGRWQSDAALRYIRDSDKLVLSVSASLASVRDSTLNLCWTFSSHCEGCK